ncbi:MAG: exonuclease SbcCD subunit D [Acholeplasmataceae bacterium]|nr:exonuclease SbcCD subunit D [Acholeplasmataceae bacterium]
MRILASGDWHLGKIIYNRSLLEDQIEMIKEIEAIAIDKHVDVIVLTGDIYDRAIPPKEAVSAFESFVYKMILDHQIKVVVIAGNHDSQERLSFGHALLSKSGFHIAKRYEGEAETVMIHHGGQSVAFSLLPFMPYQEVRAILGDETVMSFQDAYQKMIGRMTLDPEITNILVTHAFVASNTWKPEESDSEKLLSVGGVDIVDVSLFDAFDCVLLGHIHKPQCPRQGQICYTGSPLKYSFSESGHVKSLLIVDVNDKKAITMERIPLRQPRDMVVIKGAFDEIMSDHTRIEAHQNDYVSVLLTDSDARHEPFARLKAVFPFILEMRYDAHQILFDDDALISRQLLSDMGKARYDDPDHVVRLFQDFALKTADHALTEHEKTLIRTVSTAIHEEGEDR